MTIYACIKEGIIVAQLAVVDSADGVGPPRSSTVDDEYDLVAIIPERIARPAGATETTLLHWNSGSPEFRETLPLVDLILRTIRQIDQASDGARARILAEPTNTEEYRPTATDAAAFKAAGYIGPVPLGVSTYTYAKRRLGWTDQQATDDILATADRWINALWYIRRHRLNMKELVRDATTTHEVELLLETFLDELAAAMQGVQ